MMKPKPSGLLKRAGFSAQRALLIALGLLGLNHTPFAAVTEKAFLTSELIFPLEHWHNHGSCIVEAPNGDLIVCWFHGSGERKSDDVLIEGARLKRGSKSWGKRFTMADTPGYPDTNCCLFIDPRGRLWLMWPTILANTWESALMKYRISSDYAREGPPKWSVNEVMHITPGPAFGAAITNYAAHAELTMDKNAPGAEVDTGQKMQAWLDSLRSQASNKLTSRLGWFTRAHPVVIDGKRLIVPLYSDGFSISLMNISDDWGATWHTSQPLIGLGNVQPSIARRKDGSLYTLMRDNGPAPKRLMQSESRDGGETWSPVTDTDLPNPGSGAEVATLANGHLILISNDQEQGRHSLPCISPRMRERRGNGNGIWSRPRRMRPVSAIQASPSPGTAACMPATLTPSRKTPPRMSKAGELANPLSMPTLTKHGSCKASPKQGDSTWASLA